jgi:hypothetical protein
VKEKNNSFKNHLLSMPNNIKKKKQNENSNKEINIKGNSNKKIINNQNFNSNNNINNNRFITINVNTINQTKEKSKSLSKFFLNKNVSNAKIHEQNETIINQDSKDITPEKRKRLSIFKSSKANQYKIKTNLPYVPTLGSLVKDSSKKKNNNYIKKYNIIPLVLPIIGIKQDEKINKII